MHPPAAAVLPEPTHRLPCLPPPPQLNRVLEAAANSWTFDAFELAELTRGRPLSVLAFFLLKVGVVAVHCTACTCAEVWRRAGVACGAPLSLSLLKV